MKLIPQTKRNEGKSKAETGWGGYPLAKKRRHDMKLFVNAECHFQQLSDNFHFVFILAGDLPRLRVSRQLVENGRRSGKIGRKASLGFHFALQFACRRPPMEEAEDRGAAQTCNDIHRRKRWNFLIACKCFISLIFRMENPRQCHPIPKVICVRIMRPRCGAAG